MKRFGLIGHPIAHSLSPFLFKAGYDGKYPYELIETSDFDEAYSRFLSGYQGINVTAPFKELAYAKADILSDECKLIKATNLLINSPEGVKAYNSDFLGVRLWIQEVMDPAKEGQCVLITGCGGAGKAAAIAAASLGLKVILMNRDMSKAEVIAESIDSMPECPKAEIRTLEEFPECFRRADIIIYNIPTAIAALDNLTDKDIKGEVAAEGKCQAKHILEANYKNPSFTDEFIAKAVKANSEASFTDGRTWLLYQAVTGYEIFTGEKPDLASMSAVL